MNSLSPQSVFLDHERWLRTVVRSRLPEPDAVEDVMQNIAMAIVRQRQTLGEITRLGAWLYQIALRQILMYRRSAGRRRRMHDRIQTLSNSSTTEYPSPVQHVLATERHEHVQQALAELNELDRQILLLKYTENWSYRQLSEHLGVKEDTVEYRLLKARRHLKQKLSRLTDPDLR